MFLCAAEVHFALVVHCWDMAVWLRGLRGLEVDHAFGDTHMVQAVVLVEKPVVFDSVVVEPGAITGFPFLAADVAEFGAAAAGHVVAAFFELDGGLAVVAAYPAVFFGDLGEGLGFGVFGAGTGGVVFAVTGATDFG